MPEHLSVNEAQQRIIKKLKPGLIEEVGLIEAPGRVMALDAKASIDLPAFSNSSMDGYALRAEDILNASAENPVTLQVIADIPAGKSPEITVDAGQAARIMTGGKIPEGANAVVPVENTDQADKFFHIELGREVKIFKAAKHGDFIRSRGQSVRAGEVVLPSGKVLTPQDIGALASLGISRVQVYQRPKIALLTTGDELVPPGEPLESGKIYDSNSFMLAAMVEQYGGQVLRLGIAPDKPKSIRQRLELAVSMKADLILSSAGVSVGTYDFVKTVVEESGELDFWRVNMRPGKPLAFGNYRNIPFIGLPGNPVSAFVGFLVFVVPAIHRLAGLNETIWPRIKVRLEHPVESDGRETYFRATVRKKNGQYLASLKDHQGSDNLVGLTRANTLLIIPSGVKSLAIGSEVDAWLLGSMEFA
ncbi:MAG: molybdopterin molybdotransferase MoeA [Anaerolineae bacterium]|nr:molybdopterin molybdotransferase MoeA [Anaerolineae bacterium]